MKIYSVPLYKSYIHDSIIMIKKKYLTQFLFKKDEKLNRSIITSITKDSVKLSYKVLCSFIHSISSRNIFFVLYVKWHTFTIFFVKA